MNKVVMVLEGVRDHEEADEPAGNRGQRRIDSYLHCRSIRIGSHKIYPFRNSPHLSVHFSEVAISFPVQILHSLKRMTLCLRRPDITRVLVHFGEFVPVIFIFTTARYGELVRAVLNMKSPEESYFDPESRNAKIQMITFILDTVTSELRDFFRNCFPGAEKVQEISEAEANERLVKSTPYP